MQKIIELKSETYEKGRVDFFVVKGREDFHSEIISLLIGLGFSKSSTQKLDFDFYKVQGNYFVYSNEMRFTLIFREYSIAFCLDTNKSKKEIISHVEKYFKIFD